MGEQNAEQLSWKASQLHSLVADIDRYATEDSQHASCVPQRRRECHPRRLPAFIYPLFASVRSNAFIDTTPLATARTDRDGPALGHPPRLRVGAQRRRIGATTILARADGLRHLALSDPEVAVVDALDGLTSPDELEVRFGALVADLLADLAGNGFLADVDPAREPAIAFSAAGIEFAGFDRFVRFVLRRGGRFAVTGPGAAVAASFGVAGLAALLATRSWPSSGLTSGGSVVAVWLLAVARLPQAVAHETAHGLVIESHGRRVGRAGFGFYWGGLSFFVDATDALMLAKRHRMAQAVAGPCADLFVAGVLSLAAWQAGEGTVGFVLQALAALIYLGVAINLLPLLQLDGYWLLADVLDRPELRHDSLRALRRWREPTEPAARGLAAYALASLGLGASLLFLAVAVWVDELWPIVRSAAHTSAGKVGAAAFLLPLALGLVAQTVQAWSSTSENRNTRGGEAT